MSVRRAVVTGGNKGIGRAVVGRLSADGFDVLAMGRDEEALAETAAEAGGRVETVVCDVADPASHRDRICGRRDRRRADQQRRHR